MKLILCKNCQDVFKLDYNWRTCKCFCCSGRYLADGLNAEYEGEQAIPLGFKNSSLIEAISKQPEEGMGEKFIAFVIPKNCPTMKKVENGNL